MKFHGLRHTTATLLLRAGVPIQHVQRILRHTDIKLTVDTYGHLVVEDLSEALDALPSSTIVDAEFWPVEGEPATGVPTPATNLGLGHGKKSLRQLPRSYHASIPQNQRPNPKEILQRFRPLWSGRQDLNLRPLGPEPSALPG